MSKPILPAVVVEAVPNFSEGRQPDVIAAVVRAVQAPGVHLLHQTSDWDHNRSVLTVAGSPEAVLEGLFQATQVAAAQINLFEQCGQHPRLGAMDVVPLVPIRGLPLDGCVKLAHQLGRRIGEELHLPVYMYEAAATRPERQNLADVRRGEFERWGQEIHLPARLPDYGPALAGPAGAVIVGARQFLIAYNFFLRTSDIRIAKRIARAIRHSSGGLPAVKALGLLVDGQAQVSVNLVDFRQTPLHTVMDEVTRLAAAHGTRVDRGELIGLIPHAAILHMAAHDLQLLDLGMERIFEVALEAALART